MKAGEDVKTATEAATEPAEAEKPMTKYGKFCQKKGINPNLIMLKISLFVMYGGKFQIIQNQNPIIPQAKSEPISNFLQKKMLHISFYKFKRILEIFLTFPELVSVSSVGLINFKSILPYDTFCWLPVSSFTWLHFCLAILPSFFWFSEIS